MSQNKDVEREKAEVNSKSIIAEADVVLCKWPTVDYQTKAINYGEISCWGVSTDCAWHFKWSIVKTNLSFC